MMNKKLLLVSANRLADPYPVYPIGISYLHTYIKKNMPETEVSLFDMNLGTIDGLAEILRNDNPDFIGVSIRNIDGANSLDRTSFIPGV